VVVVLNVCGGVMEETGDDLAVMTVMVRRGNDGRAVMDQHGDGDGLAAAVCDGGGAGSEGS
jgi:hypothetical protein